MMIMIMYILPFIDDDGNGGDFENFARRETLLINTNYKDCD
jgi:hypothetical protein